MQDPVLRYFFSYLLHPSFFSSFWLCLRCPMLSTRGACKGTRAQQFFDICGHMCADISRII